MNAMTTAVHADGTRVSTGLPSAGSELGAVELRSLLELGAAQLDARQAVVAMQFYNKRIRTIARLRGNNCSRACAAATAWSKIGCCSTSWSAAPVRAK